VTFERDLAHLVTLPTLREDKALKDLLILRKGNRLSITPVTEKEFKRICELGGAA
jgi:predicted RNA-binding protein with PUA-like domain